MFPIVLFVVFYTVLFVSRFDQENNDCVVDLARRNQCQACRLAKCLRVNMNKNGTRRIIII